MSTELTLKKDERPIVMKSGLVHWIKLATWEVLSQELAAQQGHRFVRLSELGGLVINTAEVEGVYTIEQYEDVCRVKEGQWQCAYRIWHPKKGECQCKAEFYRKERERLAKIREAEENKPLTDEERAANAENFRKMNELAALDKPDSMWSRMYAKGNTRGRAIRQSTVREWEEKNGKKANVADLAIEKNA